MMYRVDLVQTVIEEASICIEANNGAEAREHALQHCYDPGVEWHFCDSKGDAEVIEIAPLKRVEVKEESQ